MNTPKNPNAGKFIAPLGYKNLGWQIHLENEDFKRCHKLGHMDTRIDSFREFDNSLYLYRCTDVVRICDQCKHFWHTDMSD